MARLHWVTPVFDQDSLPSALRKPHHLKAGIWGVIRVLEGTLRFVTEEPPRERLLGPGQAALVQPGQRHFIEPLDPIRAQVEFYDAPPTL